VVAAIALVVMLATINPVFVEASTTYGGAVAKSAADVVGRSYQLGGTSPSGFDASGLVVYVYGLHGARIPRTVADQYKVGTAVSRRADLRAGDIVLFQSGSAKWTGIYLGNNEVVWASSGADTVVKRNITTASVSDMLVGARRLSDSAFSGGSSTPTPPAATSKADQVIATAQKFMGTPYVFGATGPRTFDCSGFTQYVFRQHGISIPRTSGSQAYTGTKVPNSQMAPGDILIFVNTYKAGISHVGIYMGNGRFIHTVPKTGVSYGYLSNTYWSSRLHSVRRVIR